MATPVISIETARTDENGYALFTVRLSEAASDSVTVDYRALPGRAVVGTDLSRVASTLTFAPGETVKTLSINTSYDNDDGLDLDFRLELFNPLRATFGGRNQSLSATGWMLDFYGDTVDVDRAMAVSDPVIVEGPGSRAVFTVSLSEAFSESRSFGFATYDGSAKAGADYTGRTGTVTFAAGQLEAVVELDLADDAAPEAAESFGLRITGAHGVAGAAGSARILDGDAALPVVSIEGGRVYENGYADFTLRLSEAASDAVTVSYRPVSGSAAVGTDFSAVENVVTFAPGETVGTITVNTSYSYEDRIDQNFFVEISNPVGAGFGGGNQTLSAVGWMLDNYGDTADQDRSVAVSGARVLEQTADGAGAAVFGVELSRAAAVPVTLAYSLTGGTATAGGDFAGGTGTVTFAAGQTRAEVGVAILPDLAREGPETFTLTLAPPYPAAISARTPALTATAAILDATLAGDGRRDILRGTGFADRMEGWGGDDSLYGRGGNDLMLGGGGHDRLDGGRGRDRMEGGRGDDSYWVDHGADTTTEARGAGTDTVHAGLDWGLAAHVENLVLTGSAALRGNGNEAGNSLTGNDGANVLKGWGARDWIRGGAGDDRLEGGRGGDRLTGGQGADRMTGGEGADRFVFAAAAETGTGRRRDTITDFARGSDEIDLSGIDANSQAGGNQAFDYVRGDGFSGRAGELRFAGGVLSGDIDGNGGADFEVALWEVSRMWGSDLIL